MTQTQHTQGPWERKDRYPLDGYKREVFGGGRHIASVHTAFGVWEANEANANLIAAAPELLERLEWAMRRLCRYPDCPEPEHAKGYAAIAKAKGETP